MAAALTVCMLVSCFSACSYAVYSYAYGSSYSSGSATVDEVYELNIDWYHGSVEIITDDSMTTGSIKLYETTSNNLNEKLGVHWYKQGNILNIKCAASGTRSLTIPEKKLTVCVAKNMTFIKLSVNTLTADISANGICASDASFSSVSGSAKIDSSVFEKELLLETTSGNITVSASEANEIKTESTSGKCSLSFLNNPQTLNIDTVSGDIMLALPQNASFTLDLDRLSGDFSSSFALKQSGKTYTCSSGVAEYEIDTTSGNVRLASTVK